MRFALSSSKTSGRGLGDSSYFDGDFFASGGVGLIKCLGLIGETGSIMVASLELLMLSSLRSAAICRKCVISDCEGIKSSSSALKSFVSSII